jgi:lipoprotein-anchoring transpeptidase ErfK/SrfK
VGPVAAEMGMGMRYRVLAGAVISTALVVSPAWAAKLKFAPATLQIFGGLGDGTSARRNPATLGSALTSRVVDFETPLNPGSIVVRTQERRLYYVLPGNRAVMYAVGVGREGFTWSGSNRVSRKAQWPEWRPPAVMIDREARRGRKIPAYMPGGPGNPLGARALYIGDTEYRIHGTSQPWSIGGAVSSGCIRMINEEVIDLYDRVQVGATVVVE